ncbi:hypothetical protein CW304_07515 [Bacillus sp. UFRGS-B20]|nr:hypothetical protein CW304_07515 [Bacillus sp. UFRGS-B20]
METLPPLYLYDTFPTNAPKRHEGKKIERCYTKGSISLSLAFTFLLFLPTIMPLIEFSNNVVKNRFFYVKFTIIKANVVVYSTLMCLSKLCKLAIVNYT